jgi:type IV secretory pathway VirB2 component (pilin)
VTLFTVPSKDTSETIPIVFNFFDRLQYGETITGSVVSISVFSGTDANPSAMLSGVATNTSTTVTQAITGGIAGTIYTVICVVTGSGSHNYSKECRLAVISAGGKF